MLQPSFVSFVTLQLSSYQNSPTPQIPQSNPCGVRGTQRNLRALNSALHLQVHHLLRPCEACAMGGRAGNAETVASS